MVARAIFVLLVVVLGACAPAVDVGTVPFDKAHKARALSLISVFENGTTALQYGYVEDIGDGRGYTCGLGFTTATGDALEVVQRYTDAVPQYSLAVFLPRSRELASTESGDTTGLEGFPVAWSSAAADVKMQAVEEAVQDGFSYTPALAHVATLGVKSALGLMVIFDAVWMHGNGDDDDGVPALITRATARAPAPHGALDGEIAFLAAFLDVRRADLLNPSDASTQAVWSEAVGRVDAVRDLLTARDFAFDGPIHVARGYDVDVP